MKRLANKLTSPIALLSAFVAYALFTVYTVHSSVLPMIDAVKAMS